jgi:hypothetical protein
MSFLEGKFKGAFLVTITVIAATAFFVSCGGENEEEPPPAGGPGIYYLDNDGDGYGDPEIYELFDVQPAGYVANSLDCNDYNGVTNPAATEECGDFTDNDCDGGVDNDPLCAISEALLVVLQWETPNDPDQTDGTGADLDLHLLDQDGIWFTSPDDCYYNNRNPNWASPGSSDDDPDLQTIDNNGLGPEVTAINSPATGETYTVGVHYAEDADFDDSCARVSIYVQGIEAYSYSCRNLVQDTFWTVAELSWTGTDANIVEIDSVTLGIDADNDGYVAGSECDDNNPEINPDTIWYEDGDGDLYGSGNMSAPTCTAPTGYYLASDLLATDTDCDDADSTINPETIWYEDGDGDDYGSGNTLTQCAQPAGHELLSALSGTNDCDDANSLINPDTTWYEDGDSDDYGDGTTMVQCSQPLNHELIGDLSGTNDCDDGDADLNPETVWYMDNDSDLYGTGTASAPSCTAPGASWQNSVDLTGLDTDCDDGDENVNPGAAEACNGVDDDCNGDIDNDDAGVVGPAIYYIDFDGDNFGDENGTPLVCSDTGYVPNSDDCDDSLFAVRPGPDASEVGGLCSDGLDNNCNGSTDAPPDNCPPP